MIHRIIAHRIIGSNDRQFTGLPVDQINRSFLALTAEG